MVAKVCVGVIAAATSVSLFGCGSSGDDTKTTSSAPAGETIAELVVGNDDLSILGTALTAADLVSTFNSTNDEFTVFAPTNDAFFKLNGTVNCLLKIPSEMGNLKDLLKYHAIKSEVMSKDLKPDQSVATLEGDKLNITVANGKVTINGDANVTQADVAASDGVVHIIDAVLVPPDFAALQTCPTASIAETAVSAKLTTLVTALTQAGLVDTFSAVDLGVVYTVFAPTDDAFADPALADTLKCVLMDENKDKLTELLTYHVVGDSYVFSSQLKDGQTLTTLDKESLNVTISDGSVMINDATVAVPNVTTTNGIVHVIDKVLVPPGFSCGSSAKTIADLVVGDTDLSVLGAALTAADLVSTFNTTDDEFTVFAPTNDAFFKLNGTVNCLLNVPSELDNLKDLLKYHVIASEVMSTDLKPDQSVDSLEGAKLNITVADGKVTINGDATVTQADVAASDGVVHIIDAVLVPPDFAALQTCPTASIAETAVSAKLTTLVTALTQAGLVDTFSAVDLGVVYTVFAPTDDAFADPALADTLKCVLMDENKDKLTELLTYHVVGDSYVFSSQLKDGQTLTTLDKESLNVTISDGSVMINDATVAVPNVTTTNGIVHVIDKVLVPPGFSCGSSATVVV